MTIPLPKPSTAAHGKSAVSAVVHSTVATIKAAISDTLTTLDNFVQLSGTPTITSGRLSGQGAVRHRDQMATDNYMVTATVGSDSFGRTRLVTCASESFDRFYAMEINSTFGTVCILKATGVAVTTSSGIFGVLIGLLGFFLGTFGSMADIPKYDETIHDVAPGDEIAVWWDEENSVIRGYLNDVEVTHADVSPYEIPHGDGYRYWGVIQGVDGADTGAQFTTIEAHDV